MPDPLDPLDLANDPTFHQLTRAAQSAPDDRTNQIANQQRDSYVNQTLQSRAQDVYTAQRNQEMDARNQQAQQDANQREQERQAKAQQAQQAKDAAEALRVAKANNVRTERNTETGREEPVFNADNKPVFNPGFTGKPREATANDGTKVPVVDFRNSKGEVAPLPADQVKWDAETRTNQFTDPTTGKLTALPGARPLTQTDPKTGKMTTMTEDPESLTLTPTPIGEDPRTMRTLEFDNRIKDATDKHALLAAQIPMFNDAAKPAHEALSAAQKAFKPFEKDQFRYQDGQIVAVSNSKQFGESLIPVTDPQMQAQAKDWLAKRDAAKKQVDDLSPPVAQAKKEQDARELELRKLAVQTVTLKQAKESHMAAFDAARASNKILGAPDWAKLEADPMASSSARADLAKTDPSTYQTLTVGEQAVNSAVLNSLTATLNGVDPKQLTESQKAVSKSLAPFVDSNGKVDAARFGQSLVAGLGAVAAASSATSSPLTGVAFKAGLEQLGQQFAAQAMADNAIKGLKSGQDTSTPDGMNAAIKAVFPVADPSAFSLNSRTFDVAGKPSTLVDLRNERTNEDVATYFPEDNVMVLGAEAHSKMGTLSAPKVADGGIPLYFGDYSRRLSDDKKSELFKTGVSAQLAGGTSVEIQDRLEAAGLGLPQIKGMLDNGQLSYQEARALKKQLYGLADTDLGQATSVDALQTWMKGNEAYSAMWNRADSIKGVAGTLGSIATGTQRSADMKGQVVTAYFDELFNRSRQTDLAFNRQGMDEARRKLYSEATGKTMPTKAAEFGNEILKQSFGSVAAITIRTGQELAYWTMADKAAAKLTGLDWLKKASDSNSERVSLSYDQTKEWFRNTSTFIAHNFIQPGSEGAAAHQAFGEIALKIADAGNLKGITDAEAVSLRDQMVAFYHADRLTPEEGAKRGFTQDAFDVRKDPAIRAALQDYADTGNPAHMSRAFNLFALDPKARAIEARSQAYVSNARAATADDMQRSAASVYGLKVSPANATALAQIAKEARGVEDPKILAAKFAAAAPLLGVKDAAAAGHILATIGGPVTNDENSWTGYIRTLESADAANVGFEFATTFFPLSKGLKIARVAAGTAAEAAVKAVGEGAINRTLSKGVQMAQTTEKAIAGNLSRFNRVLADSRFGPAFEKVKPYVLGAEEEVAPFFKPKLGQPLSRAKKLGNVVLGNLETIPKIALSEGLEEVAGETGNPNATVDTIADNAAAGFIYGGLGGPMMGISMLPLAKLGEQRALRASARDRDAWAKATNAIGANVADWKPVTAADYEAYMALMNTGNAQFTIDALAPLTKAYADVSEQLGAAPEGPTTPAVWDLLLKKQDIEQEMAGHHLALAATVANASGALAAIRDADPVKAPFYTASAKVAGGRVDFTDAEAAIIRSTPAAFTVGDTSLQGISGAGEQVAQPKAITLTDAARAQIQSEVPELGVLIETAESSKLFHMEQKAQAAQAEAAATAQATNPTPAPTNSNVKGTPFANLPNDAPATPEQRANIITHVHNHMRAMFPALTGSLNLTTTADATTTASGAGYDFTADTVNMSAPKLADETEGFTAQQTAEHILAAYKEEIDHKAQYSAAQTAYKASGDTRPFEQWRDETYGNIWTKEFTDEQRAAVSGIYESQLEDWKMAFEGLRMIRQAREAGATTEEAKLWGKFKNGATGIVEHFKALLAYLKDLATNGKLPPAIEAEIAAVEKVLSELQEAGKPTAAAVQEKVIGKPEDVTNGKAVTLTTPRNEQSVQATATVVDLAQLVGSDDPRFPSADFQPHDRTGEESKAQALEMKRNLETNPDQWKRYYEGSTTDTGKPVVAPLFENGKHATGADGKPLYYILSGNGRRNAIASLYESGNPANYEAGIRAALATDGIDSSNVTQPVAVAVTQPSSVKDAMKLAEFSNRNAQLSKSTVETAARDAASIQRGNLLNLWDTGENADPTGASNRAFFTAFARATGEPALINSDGRPSEMAVTRAENALLSLMMGDSPAVRSMLERADVLGIRRPLSGIVSRAGQLLKLAQDKPAYDIAPLVREALSSLIRFKEDAAKGLARSIDDHLAQGDMFSAATAPAVNDFARALATAPSAKAVRDVLDEYLRLADAIDTTTGDMFGAAPATRDELLQHAADSRPLTDDVAAFRLAVGEEAQAAQVVAAITPLLSALDGASKSHFRSALDYEQERLKEGIPTALAYQAGFEGEGILDPAAAAVQRWIDSVTPEEATTKLPRIITASKQQRRSIGEVLRAEMAAMTTLNKSSVTEDWKEFPTNADSLNIPREEMPQIPVAQRGAFVQFLRQRGISVTPETVAASSLKPTQVEYSVSKAEQAKVLAEMPPPRRLIVSSDNYLLDGHHQWVAQYNGNVDVLRLSIPIREALATADEFPGNQGGKPKGTRYENEEYAYLGGPTADWRGADHPEAKIVNPINPALSPDAKVDALNKLSRANMPVVQAILADLAKLGFEGKYSVKLPERIQAKASRPSIREEKPWHDIEHVRDGLRFKVSLSNFDQASGIMRVLQDHGVGVIKLDTKKMTYPKAWGWRFLAWDLKMPNGQLVEFYAPLPELDSKTVKGPNRELFEKWRNVPSPLSKEQQADMAKDIRTSRERYDAAYIRAITRMGYSSESAAEAAWNNEVARLESLTSEKSSIKATAETDLTDQFPALSRKAAGETMATSPLSDSNTSGISFTVEDSLDSDSGNTKWVESTTLNKASVGIEQPSLFTTVPVEEGRFFGKREKANASFVEKLKYLEAQAKNPALNASQRGTMRATAKRIAGGLAKGQGQLFAFDDVAGSQDAAVDALLKRLDGWQTKALESAGGRWSKQDKAHIFATDPSEALGLVEPVKVAEARADDRTLNAASVAREMREATEEDRKLLKIPPAWTDVVVAIDENSPLLAKGKDSKGRWQSIYSSAHSMAALAAKFERLKMVNAAIPDMVARIEIGISNGDEEAHVLLLIYLTGFRNGGEGDTGAKVKAYGATTLLAEHVTVNGDTVSFDFVGKLGVKQQHVVKHAGLATNLALRKNKGERLFNTSPDKVLSYLRKIGGDTFKVHDLRTWNATELANRVIKAEQAPANEVEYWAKRDAVADVVARKLGDTRKIVLESYIDPIVFASWQESANVQNASKPKLGKRDIQEAGSGALLGRTYGEYERSLRDEFLPATGVIGTATRGRLEQGVLLASPVSGPSHQEQALRAALDKASPQFRAMFADFLKDKPIAEIAKVNKLSTVAVQNIVNQMRARYMSALKALQSNLEPKASKDFNPMTGVRSEKIDGGRPDLAGGSIPAMAALDQMRNTSGAPNKMTLDMLEDTARAMFAAEPQAARDMVRVWAENRADLPENYPVPETLKSVMAEARASQSLHALMTMAAKINTFEAAMDANTFNDPARRLDTAMLIMSYRELGTEQARALSARRDPWKTPAERHAAFLMEGLLAPDPDTRAAYKSAETADQRKEILSKWLLRVNDLKASLKADGIDIDSILADYREEQATKKPLEKQYAVVVERADKATRTIVEVLQQGGTPQQAAAAAGLSILEARGKYEALLSRVHNVGVTAARDARVAMLAASPVADYSFAVAAGLHGMSIWDTPTERPSSTKTSAKPKSKAKAVTAVYDGPASTTKGMSAYEQGSLAIHDPRIIAKIADALATRKASGLDKIIEYWKASILSGPQTHIVNSVSNAAFQGYDQWLKRIPEAAVNDMLKMFGQGSDTAPTLSEFGSMIRALPAALGTAFRNSLKAYRSGNATFERYARDLSGEDALAGGEWQKHGHALGGKFGKVMRAISFDLLNAADDFFKTTAGHVEVAAAAHRIAKAEKLNGTAYEARIASLMSPGSEAWERAADYATHVTFQAKIGEGKKTIDKLDAAAVFMNRLKSEKGIKSLDFFIPFIQTPLNIFKIGVEYSPAGSFLALADMIREYRDHSKNTKLHGKDVADALGGQIYDRARFVHDMAQQLVAWGLFFALRGLVTPDDDDGLPFITGSSPWQSVKKGQRDLEGRTVPAQSIRIGSRWFSYGRLEPFATGLTLITDAIKASHQEGGMSRYLSMMVGQLKDKTFLAGLSDVVNWIEDPEKNGNQAVAHIVTGFVPNLIQQPIRNADAAVRDTKPNHKEGFLPELAKRMQYGLLPQSAPPLTDVWGRPVMKNNGDQLNQPATDIPLRIVNPIKNGTTDNVLAIDKYILAHNTKFPTLAWAPQPSPKTIEATIGGQHVSVRLTDKEANDINVNAGKAALASLGSAWDWKNPTEAGMRRIQDSLEHFRRYYRDVAKLNRAGDLQKAAKDKAAVTKP